MTKKDEAENIGNVLIDIVACNSLAVTMLFDLAAAHSFLVCLTVVETLKLVPSWHTTPYLSYF